MEKSYEKIADFIADVMTEERIKIARENDSAYGEKQKGEFTLEEFENLVTSIGRYTYSWDNKVPPFKVPLCETEYDSDHDHGAWSDRYIIEIDGRFYEVMFDYYGQGDFDTSRAKWNKPREVFKKEVTVTVYE